MEKNHTKKWAVMIMCLIAFVSMTLLRGFKVFAESCTIPAHDNNLEGDTFYGWRVCNQELINKFWRDFHFNKGDWDEGFGYHNPCNINLPLNRTFSALWLLLYSSPNPTFFSTKDFGGDILRWAYNYSAREIDELDARCRKNKSSNPIASTFHGPNLWFINDARTELYLPFFYNYSMVERAGTIVHEARHADGEHHSDCTCPRGASCDKNWPPNQSEWRKYGANVYQVMYLWLFADSAVNTTSAMKQRALDRANLIIDEHHGGFCNPPGFHITTYPQKQIYLRASSGSYLMAEDGGGKGLNANGGWLEKECKFTLMDINGGDLLNGDPVYLRTYKGYYVAAEGGGGGGASANRNLPLSWETFVIKKLNGTGPIRHWDKVALQSNRGHYMVAEEKAGARSTPTGKGSVRGSNSHFLSMGAVALDYNEIVLAPITALLYLPSPTPWYVSRPA